MAWRIKREQVFLGVCVCIFSAVCCVVHVLLYPRENYD